MALNARKGSALVRTFREQKERKKAQKKHWQLGGTTIGIIFVFKIFKKNFVHIFNIQMFLGNIMGIAKAPDEEDNRHDKDTDVADYKSDQRFAEHMMVGE